MSKKSKTYHHGALKSAIIEKASKIIADSGSVDFSIRDISNLCGVSPAAIYKHYKSRNEIAVSVALEGVKKLKKDFDKISSSKKPTLKSFGKAFINFAKNNEGYFRAMYYKRLYTMKEYSEVETVSDQLNSYIYSLLKDDVAPKDKEYIIQRLLVCVQGISFLSINQCYDLDDKTIDKIMSDNLVNIT